MNTQEAEMKAVQAAQAKTNLTKWGINSVIFLFALLIIVYYMINLDVNINIVAAVAIAGLGSVWFTGWKRGKQLFRQFYTSELAHTLDIPLEQIQNGVDKLEVPESVLTRREIEILGHMAEGCSNKMIASQLNISGHTVKQHISRLMIKLNANDRTHAVAIALRAGIIPLKQPHPTPLD